MSKEEADQVAESLARVGYSGLFLAGDRSGAPEVRDGGRRREVLTGLVADAGRPALVRLLASEVLFRHADGYPPPDLRPALGEIYPAALELTGQGGRSGLTGNLWGYPYHDDEIGAHDDTLLGAHLLAAADAAIPGLIDLLDDEAPILYEGSQDAMLGSALALRVKDVAAYFLGKLAGLPTRFHDSLAGRDAEIERLRAALTRS